MPSQIRGEQLPPTIGCRYEHNLSNAFANERVGVLSSSSAAGNQGWSKGREEVISSTS